MLQGVKTMNDTSNKENMNRISKVVEHKLEGLSTREIARLLKVSHSTVQRDYKKGIEVAFETSAETVNFQRNKITTVLNKILDTQLTAAVGFESRKANMLGNFEEYDPEEEYETKYISKDGTIYTYEEHLNIEDEHWDTLNEDGEEVCQCKEQRTKKSAEEILKLKNEFHHANYTWVEPDKESVKIVMEVCKQLATLWGANIPTGTPTVFDQRKQTIQIGDNDIEE
mgnify:FL=1